MNYSRRELKDLAVAWLALGLAFGLLLSPISATSLDVVVSAEFVFLFAVSLVTAGVGFLGHELAHKAVAVHFGQHAEFRADYGMLLLAIAGGLAGFLFAAPGAVHHAGRITPRQRGLVALAGPVSNLAMAAVFWALTPLSAIAEYGVLINVLLAGFNMLPFGPLDGNTVRKWSLGAYLAVAVPSILLALRLLGFL
ncbi:metalloprotease [Salarchaeum japonicum]|uniref:metalloprotease n=1 Tax=Salarchaeum japonicum TaxID=555573 RepID=UPI003C735194